MKKIITLILYICIVSTANSQDRINREKLSFVDSSMTLTNATGWAYNKTIGEWIDFPNLISNDKLFWNELDSNRTIIKMSNSKQNFLTIQTKKIVYKNVKYYVLIIDKWSGTYSYPSIMKGWNMFKKKEVFIYSESEFKKMFNPKNKVEIKTKYSFSYRLNEFDSEENKILDLIQTELEKDKSKSSVEYILPIFKTNDNLIRFLIPEFYLSKYNIDDNYFETEFSNFAKILIH